MLGALMDRKLFGDEFKAWMAGRNYRDVAADADMHFTTLYNWAAKAPPKYETFVAFADRVGMDPEWRERLMQAGGWSAPTASGFDRFLELAAALERKYNRPTLTIVQSIRCEGGLASLTPEAAESLIRRVEEILQLEDAELGPPEKPA